MTALVCGERAAGALREHLLGTTSTPPGFGLCHPLHGRLMRGCSRLADA